MPTKTTSQVFSLTVPYSWREWHSKTKQLDIVLSRALRKRFGQRNFVFGAVSGVDLTKALYWVHTTYLTCHRSMAFAKQVALSHAEKMLKRHVSPRNVRVKFRGVAQPGSASGLGPESQKFESSHLD